MRLSNYFWQWSVYQDLSVRFRSNDDTVGEFTGIGQRSTEASTSKLEVQSRNRSASNSPTVSMIVRPQLWREVKAHGFTGGAAAVRDFVRPLRAPGMTPTMKRAERLVPSTRALSWLLVLPERHKPEQTTLIEKLCATCPSLSTCRELVLTFQDILRRRAKDELDGWLERAKSSELPAFATFVRGIRADYAAVKAAFSLSWSNGPTEGHVNRLKFIKRQGYGGASFDLLKRRVLPLTA